MTSLRMGCFLRLDRCHKQGVGLFNLTVEVELVRHQSGEVDGCFVQKHACDSWCVFISECLMNNTEDTIAHEVVSFFALKGVELGNVKLRQLDSWNNGLLWCLLLLWEERRLLLKRLHLLLLLLVLSLWVLILEVASLSTLISSSLIIASVVSTTSLIIVVATTSSLLTALISHGLSLLIGLLLLHRLRLRLLSLLNLHLWSLNLLGLRRS